ncbi:unnamed protein product, partial [Mesorhabditis spiculigera]
MNFTNLCPDGLWPPGPHCSNMIAAGIETIFCVLNVGFLIYYLRSRYENLQTTKPWRKCFTLTIQGLLLALTLTHLAYNAYQFKALFIFEDLAAFAFWATAFAVAFQWRKTTAYPYIEIFVYVFGAATAILPLFNVRSFFPYGVKNVQGVFYITYSTLVGILIVTVGINCLPSCGADNPWANFGKKVEKIAPYVWPKKSLTLQFRVVLCLILLVFGRLINLALPLYNKWIVDALGEPHNFPYMLILISTGLKFLQGNGAMGGFLNTLRTYLWIPIQQYTTREIEVELFEHLHSLSLRWHLGRQTGMVLRVMDRGTQSVNSILNYILFNIVPTLADIAIAVVFFFTTFNYYFGLIVLATMVIYLAFTILITEWRTQFRREMNEKENNWSAIGTDSLLNYETVKYYGNEQYEADRFRKAIQEYQFAEWRSNASLAFLNLTQNSIIGAGLVAGSLLVAYLIASEGKLSVGDYVLFTTYILQLYTPLNFFGTVYRTIQRSFIDMENMFDLMEQEVEVADAPNAIEYYPTDGCISVQNVSFEYTPGTPVLNDISFEVKSGETIALVGESGSGKSTMIRLLFRLFEVGSGTLKFDGTDVKMLKLRTLRKQIGIVPQDTVLFNDTIRYNIRFGNPTASDEEVEEAAKAAMIHEKIMALPNRYETLVGERGLKLSGGEKQRVAIARTILKKPQFIFLDEATSALDTPTERAIQRCLEDLCASRTSVVVAHRLSTIVNASQILVLHKGQVVERGRHHDLLLINGLYARMWESQSQSEAYNSHSPNPKVE